MWCYARLKLQRFQNPDWLWSPLNHRYREKLQSLDFFFNLKKALIERLDIFLHQTSQELCACGKSIHSTYYEQAKAKRMEIVAQKIALTRTKVVMIILKTQNGHAKNKQDMTRKRSWLFDCNKLQLYNVRFRKKNFRNHISVIQIPHCANWSVCLVIFQVHLGKLDQK